MSSEVDNVSTTSLMEDSSSIDIPVNPKSWSPLLVPKSSIEGEIRRLSSAKVQEGVPRRSFIVHPDAPAGSRAFAPGLAVSINVLLPGEQISLLRDNATRVEFCISGDGRADLAGDALSLQRFDVWTVPSMTRRAYRNPGAAPLVWLSYSNMPLLDLLGIHYAEDAESRGGQQLATERRPATDYVRQNAPDIPILSAGARLRGYEYLVDIEVRENRPLLWPWADVYGHLAQRPGDGKRTIMLLYNPATERRNGTTHSFFATMTSWPAGEVRPVPPRGHRHSSFACNYHFTGRGRSVVDGRAFEWREGDLLLSAPNWSEHAHGSSEEGACVLTVQDHPLQIGMESLIWQEQAGGPILTLGSEAGVTGYVGPREVGD